MKEKNELAYEKAKIAIMDDLDAIRTAKEEGKEENRREIAREMLKDKVPIQKISHYTGLSEEEIEKINKIA